jgi:PTS system mannose-specific IIC component
MGAETIILAALLGAALELDEYYIFMTLFSQPVIAGGLAGLLFGDAGTGIMIGAIVQLIWIMPPVGAYVPPSPSAIAFTAAGIGILAGTVMPANDKPAFLMFALIAGASFGYFTGQMDVWNRKLNTRIMRAFEGRIEQGHAGYAYLVQAIAVAAKYLRDSVYYLVIFAFGVPLFIKIYMTLPDQVVAGLKIAFWAAPMIGFAVLFDMFSTKPGGVFHGTTLILTYLVFSQLKVSLVLYILLLMAAGLLVVYDQVWSRKGASNLK